MSTSGREGRSPGKEGLKAEQQQHPAASWLRMGRRNVIAGADCPLPLDIIRVHKTPCPQAASPGVWHPLGSWLPPPANPVAHMQTETSRTTGELGGTGEPRQAVPCFRTGPPASAEIKSSDRRSGIAVRRALLRGASRARYYVPSCSEEQ